MTMPSKMMAVSWISGASWDRERDREEVCRLDAIVSTTIVPPRVAVGWFGPADVMTIRAIGMAAVMPAALVTAMIPVASVPPQPVTDRATLHR